jgi:DNA ligase-1
MKRKKKHNIEESVKEVPVTVWIFDLIKLGDKDYTNTPYIMRKEILIDVFHPSDKLKRVNYREVKTPAELIDYFNEARGMNMEGLICKQSYGHYEAGKRGNNWVKLKSLEGAKMADTIDVVVIGGYNGRGRRAQAGIAGSLLCAIY